MEAAVEVVTEEIGNFFAQVDTNDDGKASIDELKQAVADNLGVTYDEVDDQIKKAAEQVWRHVDANGDQEITREGKHVLLCG